MWFHTKQNDDLTLTKRIAKVESRLTSIEAEILDLATAINIIRNKVLKKIQFKNPEKEEESEDLYNGMLLKSQ